MKAAPSKRKRATPDAILATARQIARERGWGAVTIRAIADSLGYASPLIYEHFQNKEAAFDEVARLGFSELEAALLAIDLPSGTVDRIVALSQAYVDFSSRHPELYRVMHGMDGVALNPEILAQGATRVCKLAMDELTAWAVQEGINLTDPLAATETLWCLLHGIATLRLAGRLEASSELRIADAVRALLTGWRSPA